MWAMILVPLAVVLVGRLLGPLFVARLGILVATVWLMLWGALVLILGPGWAAADYLVAFGWAIGGAVAIALFGFALAWVFAGASATRHTI